MRPPTKSFPAKVTLDCARLSFLNRLADSSVLKPYLVLSASCEAILASIRFAPESDDRFTCAVRGRSCTPSLADARVARVARDIRTLAKGAIVVVTKLK